MASKTQQTLYDTFQTIAGGGAVVSALQNTTTQLSALSAVTSNTARSTGNAVASAVTKVFTSGLGLVPLIGGLFGLFGGGHEEPPPLVKYTMPSPIYFQGADTGANVQLADYDQMGLPRAYVPTHGGTGAPSTAITVNVQAMDARSFLDHSNEIAQAVRQAMLNLNSINDVVSDL